MNTQYFLRTNRLLAAGVAARSTKHHTSVIFVFVFAVILLMAMILAAVWYYLENKTDPQNRSRNIVPVGLESDSESAEAKIWKTVVNETDMNIMGQQKKWSTQFVETRKRRGKDYKAPIPQTSPVSEKKDTHREPISDTGSDHGPVNLNSDSQNDSTSSPYRTFGRSRNGSSTTEEYDTLLDS